MVTIRRARFRISGSSGSISGRSYRKWSQLETPCGPDQSRYRVVIPSRNRMGSSMLMRSKRRSASILPCSAEMEGRDHEPGEPLGPTLQDIERRPAVPPLARLKLPGDLGIGHPFMIEGQGDNRRARQELENLDLPLHGAERILGEAVVMAPSGGMLEDDALGSTGHDQLEAPRIGRMCENPLPFEDNRLRSLLDESPVDDMFDLPGDEIAHEGIEDDTVLDPLHPGGLARPDHDRPATQGVQGLGELQRRRAFAHGRVGAEHRDPYRRHLLDFSREKVEVFPRRGAPHIPDAHAVRPRQPGKFGIIAEELVQSRIDVQTGPQRCSDDGSIALRQTSAVGGQADDEVLDPLPDLQRLFEGTKDRYAARLTIQNLPGILPGPGAVDHPEDAVPIGVADESVGRFATGSAEGPLAQDDCGPIHRTLVHSSPFTVHGSVFYP